MGTSSWSHKVPWLLSNTFLSIAFVSSLVHQKWHALSKRRIYLLVLLSLKGPYQGAARHCFLIPWRCGLNNLYSIPSSLSRFELKFLLLSRSLSLSLALSYIQLHRVHSVCLKRRSCSHTLEFCRACSYFGGWFVFGGRGFFLAGHYIIWNRIPTNQIKAQMLTEMWLVNSKVILGSDPPGRHKSKRRDSVHFSSVIRTRYQSQEEDARESS